VVGVAHALAHEPPEEGAQRSEAAAERGGCARAVLRGEEGAHVVRADARGRLVSNVGYELANVREVRALRVLREAALGAQEAREARERFLPPHARTAVAAR
jgi:hypothetical protein